MRILVLSACGLRPDYLGCYGNDWVATPTLDRLASEGIVFDRHYADGPQLTLAQPPTGPSLADVCKAHHIAFAHMVAEGPADFARRVLPSCSMLADETRGLLWIDGPTLLPPWNLPADMLDAYVDDEIDADTAWPRPPPSLLDADDDGAVVRVQNTYAAVVTYFDAQIGVLLDELRKRNLADDMALCVATRSGLALGERGAIGMAGICLHEEFVHLPLILRLPGGTAAGRRVSALTQPPDLQPTLLRLLDVPMPPGDSADCDGKAWDGKDLGPLWRGQANQIRPYAVSSLRVGDGALWALRTPQWSYLLPERSPADDTSAQGRLFCRPDDRWEVNDLRQHHLDLAESLEQILQGERGASAP